MQSAEECCTDCGHDQHGAAARGHSGRVVYWGSSAAWRVTIALQEKGLPFESVCVDSEQLSHPDFIALNPRRQVPVLIDQGETIYESIAIVRLLQSTMF